MTNLTEKAPKPKPQPEVYKIKLGPDKPKPPKKLNEGWLIKWGK